MSKEYEKGEDPRVHAPRQVNRVGRERVGKASNPGSRRHRPIAPPTTYLPLAARMPKAVIRSYAYPTALPYTIRVCSQSTSRLR